ncbi:MAG TPA: hypothetical protein VI669_01600, partial [Vicinamibacteria bacterium]
MAAAAPPAAVPSIRERVAAQGKRIKRVKMLDRFAVGFITAGGLFIIVAVLFIFVFILGESLPLFRSASGASRGTVNLSAVPPMEASVSELSPSVSPSPSATTPASAVPPSATSPAVADFKPLVLGIDEYQMYFYEILADGRTVFFKASDGAFAKQLPLGALAGATIRSASRSLMGESVALGTSDGRVSLQQVRFTPRYEEQKLVDLDIAVRDRGLVELDPAKRELRDVAYEENDGRKSVAAIVGDTEVLVWRTDDEGVEHRATLQTQDGEKVTRVRLGRSDTLIASTVKGNLYHWELTPEVRLTEVAHVSEEPITAVEYILGGITAIVGDAKGNLGGWFRVRLKEEDTDLRFVKAHTYPPQGVAINAIGASTRDKSFVTAGADGSLVLRHMTSERSVIAFPATGQAVDS